MTQIEQYAYDNYAAAALQALIAKFPIIDRDGEHSADMKQEDLDALKNDVARSAHGYAFFMMQSRKEFIDALEPKVLKPEPNPGGPFYGIRQG